MKINYLFISLFTLAVGCQPTTQEKVIEKSWQGQPIDFSQIREVVNAYHMFDSTETKVGSMVFGFSFENGMLVARDTSQFDNGSVYETAVLTFDTSDFQMKEVSIDMKTPRATLDIDLRKEDERVIGSYVIKQDTINNPFEIDSAYQFTTFREEIYVLAHSLNLKSEDTVSFDALVPTSMSVSQAQLMYSGEETIETANGMVTCDAIWLKADGKMPDNKIWISKTSPRTIVKFYVPGPGLNIELVSQR
ncbi:hypothetical protein [Ekhidna sp.]|uniref:hypothetical protein n=1 Tax=Ekhidna sp. TaxID=2608089 RepID=UPI003B58EC22